MRTIIKLILFLLLISPLSSQYYIRDVYIDSQNVFDTTSSFNRFLNFFHAPTKKYIIDDELLFYPDEDLDTFYVYETERNLRLMNLFTDVEITYDTVGANLLDVIVTTRDRWSLTPAVLYGNEGGAQELGFLLSEANLLGHGYDVEFEALDRTENDIGLQGRFELFKRRFLRFDLDLYTTVISNQFKTFQEFNLFRPYRDFYAPYSFGAFYTYEFGNDFIYSLENQSFNLLNIDERRASAYFSKSWVDIDRVFATIFLDVNQIDRGDPGLRRAFDNTGKFIVQFSSVSEAFERTNKLNLFKDEDLQTGGYGEAILGRTFPLTDEGDRVWYAGGRGERSYYDGKWYLYGQVAGGSGFIRNRAIYTYQEFTGLAFYRFSDSFLASAKITQQTSWNWPADRQLVLDPTTGLRGFNVNSFAGDNRIIGNFELRGFPEWRLWVLDFSGTAFFDIGTVWDQDTGFENTKWRKSVGLGFRIHNAITTGENSIFRFDFAWNLEENRFGGIIFTTDHLFYVFRRHQYRIPDFFGLDFDDE